MVFIYRKIRDLLLVVCLFALLFLIAAKLDHSEDLTFSGRFHAIDGDTLATGRERLRLAGIDAPELAQTCIDRNGSAWACGEMAKRTLAKLVEAEAVVCRGQEVDRYGRPLVLCHAGDRDLNAAMVGSGFAVASGAYGAEQNEARRAAKGIWAGDFENPRDYRASQELADGPNPVAMLVDWVSGLFGKANTN